MPLSVVGAGGGSGSGPPNIPTAWVRCSTSEVVAAGDIWWVPWDGFTLSPAAVGVMAYTPDGVSGHPGIQILTQGLYEVTGVISVSGDTPGTVALSFDIEPGNGTQILGAVYGSFPNATYDNEIPFMFLYYTATGQDPDAIGVYLTNRTTGSVTVVAGARMLMTIKRLDASLA